jgi:signal transduction histidine kinase
MIRRPGRLGQNVDGKLMTRHTSPFAVALCASLVALLVGLFALHGVIAAERADALAAARLRRAAAEQHAARELAIELGRRAHEAGVRIDAALADPLRPCDGCFLSRSGEQLLPRVRPSASSGRSPRYYLEALTGRADAVGAGDATWSDRARLHNGCRRDPDRAARAVLEHRARYALPVEQEIGSALALLEVCPPSPLLAAALLRDGADVPGARRVEGLQPTILRHLRHLGADAAAFAVDRVLDESRRARVRTDDFEARTREVVAAPLPVAAGVAGPAIASAAGGRIWYLEPIASGVEGVSVELGPLLAEIAAAMRSGVLLGPEDRIDLTGPAARPVLLEQVRLEVTSPAAAANRSEIQRRYLLKLGLLILCGAMGAGVAGLGLALQGRRRRLLEVKAQFVADVSHELRTPLASMRVLAETLARRTQDLAQVRDYPARLLRDIDGMSHVVENILSFNRVVRGRWQVRRDVIALSELIEGVCQEAAERAGKPVVAEVDAGDVGLSADPELVRLLLRNLAVNAIAYNRRDPAEIRAQARPADDGSLELLFTDNGVGIAAAEQERVFAEFHRGPQSSMARGSGLGLALCRRIMALHGGTIAISASGGWGTTFRLWFPRAPS